MSFRTMVLTVLQPFTQVIGKVHPPFSHKLVKYRDVRSVRRLMRLGDLIVTNTAGEPSNLPIPGFWGHAATVAGNFSVLEAIGEGLVETMLEDFLMSKDYFALLSPRFATDEQRRAAVHWLFQREGRAPYDYKLELGGKALYCSEAHYRAYAETMDCPVKPETDFLGGKVVTPQQFFDDQVNYERKLVRGES